MRKLLEKHIIKRNKGKREKKSEEISAVLKKIYMVLHIRRDFKMDRGGTGIACTARDGKNYR